MTDPLPQVETQPVVNSEPKKSSASKLFALVLALGALGCIVIFIVALYVFTQQKDNDITPNTDPKNVSMDLDYYRFGEYSLMDVGVEPNVKSYTVNSDLSNVYFLKEDDPDGYYRAVLNEELTATQKTTLAQDQFIITQGETKEFFPVYETNRYSYVPNFITVDSVMHTYHLMFDSMLKDLEENYLAGANSELTKIMVSKSLEQYDEYSADQELANAAKRNVAFFSVAAKLMDPTFSVPVVVESEVNAELALINDHSEFMALSPVMAIGFDNPNALDNLKEDYTQFIPRGHYTKSDLLKKYFTSMMWQGRVTFLSKDKTTVLSALLISDVIANNDDVYTLWDSIYAPINFFVGKADDITYYEYKAIYDVVFPDGFVNDANKIETFFSEVKKLEPPQINSIPIFDETIQPDRAEVITGFRFMGQRFTVDAMIFQNLIYRDVLETADGDRKMLPTMLEVPAAIGDDTALDIIKSDTNFYTFPNYEAQMTKLRTSLSEIGLDKWTQNLYWSWIYTLNGMVGDTPEGYPGFMLTDKWQRKELNTYVSSLTELKHDTILYSKQVMAEMGDAGPDQAPDDKGYVEPNLETYRRLLALVQMTRSGLLDRDLITATNDDECRFLEDRSQKAYCNLDHLESVVTTLINISKKELVEEPLTQDEYDFIRNYGGELETMFLNTLDPDANRYTAVDDNPAMLIADVASAPGEVLEEGTGYINNIYVIVPVEGELRITKGAVYSQYEFKVPSSSRMTNEQWRAMLEQGTQPEMVKWQKELITK
jgi:hypothetical protein